VRGASDRASRDDAAQSDEELLRRFVAGDDPASAEAAFAELVARHRDRVLAICTRYFRDPVEAEDAAQEAFVALHRRAGSFAGTARFTTWLYRLTVNSCTDLARKRVRRPQSSGYDPDWLSDPRLDDLGRLELDLDLRRAVAALPPDFRTVVVLRHLEGLAYDEIAAATGLAMGTVKSRLHRAHALLVAALGDGGEQPVRGVRPTGAAPAADPAAGG
jgi:RNA polymerase sigma-70 factor, ECF subfamily